MEPIRIRNLRFSPDLFKNYLTGTVLDRLLCSYSGLPKGVNYMIIGDPGVGKTTIILDMMANIQQLYPGLKILLVSAEMNDIDLILDPGFGFIGSTEADYACMRQMERLKAYERPILVGVSRKSIVWRPLGLTPETCLCATQALQLYALEHGATIIRTHDVRETAQTIEIYNRLCIS